MPLIAQLDKKARTSTRRTTKPTKMRNHAFPLILPIWYEIMALIKSSLNAKSLCAKSSKAMNFELRVLLYQ